MDVEKTSDGNQAVSMASHEYEIDNNDPTIATMLADNSIGGTSTQYSTIKNVIYNLVQAINDDKQNSNYLATHTGLTIVASQYHCIPIKDFLDYLNAESWLGSFYSIAIRYLDDNLELHILAS